MFGVKMPFIGGFVLYIHMHDKHDKKMIIMIILLLGNGTRDARRETRDLWRAPCAISRGIFPPRCVPVGCHPRLCYITAMQFRMV